MMAQTELIDTTHRIAIDSEQTSVGKLNCLWMDMTYAKSQVIPV